MSSGDTRQAHCEHPAGKGGNEVAATQHPGPRPAVGSSDLAAA